jgi:uncharacterized protein (UPF0212 family)
MAELTIMVSCPKCEREIEAVYIGSYKKLLGRILQRAGHQPGDKTYAEIMEKVNFPGE